MQFRTIVPRETYPFDLDYRSKSFWMGSCFVTNMGQKMKNLRFPILLNPFGVSYNPQSIVESLELVLKGIPFQEDNLFYANNLWNNFRFHSSFSNPSKDEYLKIINKQLSDACIFLKESAYMFITLGTSYVFRLKDTGQVVNNCHKLPADYFVRDCLSIDQIVDLFRNFFYNFTTNGIQSKVVFSISPIRHLKDGAHGNQISKSTLLLAINKIIQEYPFCFYFPSYEILMDDLRDYRFYAEDMCHPSIVAQNYIWDYFTASFFKNETLTICKKIEAINKSLEHRPFNPNTEKHQLFLEQLDIKISKLKEDYPLIQF